MGHQVGYCQISDGQGAAEANLTDVRTFVSKLTAN